MFLVKACFLAVLAEKNKSGRSSQVLLTFCMHMYPVACRGGANGANAPGIQGMGYPKSEIIKI